MYYSIIIFVLMIVCLVIYFVFNQKIKMPTRLTEFVIDKYNKKLKKIAAISKKNEINFDEKIYQSKIESEKLTLDNLEKNIKTLKKIKKNTDLIKNALALTNKDEFEKALGELAAGCELFEFKDELKTSEEDNKLFEVFDFKKSKLDFEMQKYFGSQDFFVHDEKYFFFDKNKAYVIDTKNVFKSDVLQYNLEISESKEKTEEKVPIFELKILELNLSKKIQVPQKNIQNYLRKKIKPN